MRGNPDLAHELAVFLRSRRERLVPAQVGLPERGRPRRTPGLRREEVAELAGVSVDYVVRLEQGRGLHPSPEVLDALARALRLSQDERAYLFAMASQRPAPRPRLGCAEASPGANVPAHDSVTARLVHDLSPLPAMLVDHRGDLLAWNAEMGALLLMDDDSTAGRPNVIELCLFHPELRQFYLDRETVIREAVADLRAAWAAHPDDVRLASLIDEWCGRSEEFARHWESRDVRVNGHGVKRLAHPRIGEVTVEFEVLTPLPDPAQRLVIYRPADAGSREALGRLGREYANS